MRFVTTCLVFSSRTRNVWQPFDLCCVENISKSYKQLLIIFP